MKPTLNLLRLNRQIDLKLRRLGVRSASHLLVVSVLKQRMTWLRLAKARASPTYHVLHKDIVVSTSRFGVGQAVNSNRTPLGLHRVFIKVGAGWPVGAVFQNRKPIGYVWQGHDKAPIAHRIMWLEGLEPRFNRGGEVDSSGRHIYVHGLGDESSLGRPASRGCIHLSAKDLIPLFDRVPVGTLVWITNAPV